MQELIDKAKEIIENQFDYILKIQGRGRELPSLTILHALDALDCYRRIKSHSETVSETEIANIVRESMNDTIQELQHRFSN